MVRAVLVTGSWHDVCMPEQPAPFRYSLQTESDGLRVHAPGVTDENHEQVVEAVQAVLRASVTNVPRLTARDAVDDLLAEGARETEPVDHIAEAIRAVIGSGLVDSQAEPSPADLLTIPEAVSYSRVSRDTLRRAVDAGHLRRFGSERRVLFLRADLLAWLEMPKERIDRTPVETRSFAADGVNLGW